MPETLEQKRERLKQYYRKLRLLLVIEMGGICTICGFDDPRALQVDHVLGNGRSERKPGYSPIASGKKQVMKTLARYKAGELQLLCANCNSIKRIEAGEVPHQHKPYPLGRRKSQNKAALNLRET